jgi:hypothetical protein
MPVFKTLYLAVLTKNEDDAGTDNDFNLTINVEGDDILDQDYGSDLDDGEAALFGGGLDTPLELGNLTNSSVRVGLRDDDACGLQNVLVFGETQPDFLPGRTVAFAMETDIDRWISTDVSEGKLTTPVRLVSSGSSTTVIRRVLMLIDTRWEHFTDTETDSPIELEVRAGGNIVLKEEKADTPQPDLESGTTNWYEFEPAVPFTRDDIVANGGITLRILGDDAWLPLRLYLFGLDTASGRPNEVVSLSSVPVWSFGWMSTDSSEGVAEVELPVATV